MQMIYSFANFELDSDVHELRDDGVACSVEPQVFDLLVHLVEHRDRLVTREELFEHVWHGRPVSDATLSSRIKAVRQAVGDSGKRQSIVQTVPRRGFRFVAEVQAWSREAHAPLASPAEAISIGDALPALPDKPSVVVLPFVSLSADPEQEYFADGMADDIITALSRFRWLFVIARNSALAYKGQAIDVRRVGEELGVRYVVQGSVRSDGERIRVTAQLLEASTGAQAWAERYDRPLTELFALQDEITDTLVGAIAPEIDSAERQRAHRQAPGSVDIWLAFQEGLAAYHSTTPQGLGAAARIFDQICERAPDFAPALAHAADARSRAVMHRYVKTDPRKVLDEAQSLSQRAMAADHADPMALWAHARVKTLRGANAEAEGLIERAIALNPNDAKAHHVCSFVMLHGARYLESLAAIDRAIRLSPRDIFSAGFHAQRSMALFSLERYEECALAARRAIGAGNPRDISFAVLAAAQLHLGDEEAARETVRELRARRPDYSLQTLWKDDNAVNALRDALRPLGIKN
jgi:TolB-like protein/tetratricopeptide (TPR) repeat protein